MARRPGQDADMSLKLAITAALVNTDEIVEEVSRSTRMMQNSISGIGAMAGSSFLAIGGAVAGIGVAAIAGLRSLTAFEDAFAGVRKTVDADEAALAKLNKEIRVMATELPVAANELARIGELGGQLGVGTENLEAFIDTVTKLSVSTVLSTENAALALARLAAIANIPEVAMSNFFERTGASLVELGNNFAATEDEIITTVLRIATAAEQTGASTQDALAFATALQAIGVPAQAGGTAVSRVFQEIQRAISDSGEQLQLFSAIADMSMIDFTQLFQEDAAMAVTTFIEGLSSAEERVDGLQNVLKKLNLSQRRTQLAVGGLAAAQGLLRDALITSRTAFDANIALQVEAAKKFTTTASQIQLLRNQVKEFTMDVAEGLMPWMRKMIFRFQALALGAAEVTDGAKAMAKALAGTLVISALGFLVAALAKVALAYQSAAKGAGLFAVLSAGGNLPRMIGMIIGLGIAVNKINKIFEGTRAAGGMIAFAETLGTVGEFAKGANRDLDALQKSGEVIRNEFQKKFGFSFEDLGFKEGAEITAETLEAAVNANSALQGTGLFGDGFGKQENQLLNAAKHIQSIDRNVTSLGTQLDFLFDQNLEELTKTTGPVGQFFRNLTELDLPSTENFLEKMLRQGQDPRSLARNLVPPIMRAIQEEVDTSQGAMMPMGFGMTGEREVSDREKILNQMLTDLKNLANGHGVLSDAVTKANNKALSEIAEQMLARDGEVNINEGMVAKKVELLQTERETNAALMRRSGISEEIIASSELSKSIKEMDLAIQQEIIDAQDAELQRQYEILTEQERIAENVFNIAQQSSRSIVSLFDDIPAQIKMSASEITRNLQDQFILTQQFMATIQALQTSGYTGLAAMLAEQGPAALTAAQNFLNSPQLAAEANNNILLMREDMMRTLAEIPDEMELSSEDLIEKFEPSGKAIVDGLASGIRLHGDDIKQAIIESVENGEKGLILEFGIKSPAERFKPYGKAFIDGIISGMASMSGGMRTMLTQVVLGALGEIDGIKEKAKREIGAFGSDIFASDNYKEGLAEFKTTLISTFNLFTQFDRLTDDIANHQTRIAEAQEEYQEAQRQSLKITENLADANADLADAIKKFGTVGIQTDFESLQINKARLKLLNQQSDVRKSDRASERLAIKDQKREIEFLEQAVKRGVASEDELQAAKEALADMTGTTEGISDFKDRAVFQERLDLMKSISDAEIQLQKDLLERMKVEAVAEHDTVKGLQERIAQLERDEAASPERELAAQKAIKDEEMNRYGLQLQLLEVGTQIAQMGPEGVKQFKAIATAAGMPEEQIDAIIAKSKTMGKDASEQFDSVAKGLFDIKYQAEQGAVLNIDTDQAEIQILQLQDKIDGLLVSMGLQPVFDKLWGTSQSASFLAMQKFAKPFTSGWNLDSGKHAGGLIDMGNRALVGEFGPEMVSVRPGGATVQSLGRVGSGVTVNNLNVNVTGVPSDPQSARKAAVSIRKALVNLEKEGSSSSLLGR